MSPRASSSIDTVPLRFAKTADEWREVALALTRALTKLTPGGSEYFVRAGDVYIADAVRCVEVAEGIRRSLHEGILRAHSRTDG